MWRRSTSDNRALVDRERPECTPAANRESVARVRPVDEDHGALDDVLELADVAGPVVALKALHQPVGHALDVPPQAGLLAATKCQTSSGMSSGRSRSGGS